MTLSTEDSEVLAAADALVSAFGRFDTDAYFSLIDPTATFLFHTTDRLLGSRAEYEAEWDAWRREAGFRVLSCESSDRRVRVFGDIGLVTHTVHTVVSTNDGEDTLRERESIVFRRSGDGWLVVHEHLSPFPPS